MNQCHVTELRTHFDSVSRVLLVLLNYTHLERNAKHDYNHVPVFELVTWPQLRPTIGFHVPVYYSLSTSELQLFGKSCCWVEQSCWIHAQGLLWATNSSQGAFRWRVGVLRIVSAERIMSLTIVFYSIGFSISNIPLLCWLTSSNRTFTPPNILQKWQNIYVKYTIMLVRLRLIEWYHFNRVWRVFQEVFAVSLLNLSRKYPLFSPVFHQGLVV